MRILFLAMIEITFHTISSQSMRLVSKAPSGSVNLWEIGPKNKIIGIYIKNAITRAFQVMDLRTDFHEC